MKCHRGRCWVLATVDNWDWGGMTSWAEDVIHRTTNEIYPASCLLPIYCQMITLASSSSTSWKTTVSTPSSVQGHEFSKSGDGLQSEILIPWEMKLRSPCKPHLSLKTYQDCPSSLLTESLSANIEIDFLSLSGTGCIPNCQKTLIWVQSVIIPVVCAVKPSMNSVC